MRWRDASGPLRPFSEEESNQPGLTKVVVLGSRRVWGLPPWPCSLTQGTCSLFLLVNTSTYLLVPPLIQELLPKGNDSCPHTAAKCQKRVTEEPF